MPVPEVEHDDVGCRLREVATITDKMRVALGKAIRTLWCNNPGLRSDLGGVLELL